MGQLSQLIVMVEAQGVDAVLNALGQVDTAQTKLADDSKKSAGVQKGAAEKVKASWQEMATGINQAMGIARTAINAGKAVFDFTKESAQLQFVATKFDRLATSAGTSSDALLADLKRVSRGIMSDAELMETATTMMTLGLATTHDEAVRLTNVASQLGMSMNQLVLTLTNRTTMRFDTLGVKVAGFDEKLAALEKTGLGVQEAFTQAFLQQAEEQIATVGSVADTTAGKLMALEASWKNLKNAFQEKLANSEGLLGVLSHLTLDLQVSTANVKWEDLRDNVAERTGLSKSQMSKFSGFKQPYYGNSAEQDQLFLDDADVSMKNFGALLQWQTRLQREYGLSAEEAGVKLGQMIDTFGTGILTGSMTNEWADGIEGTRTSVVGLSDAVSDLVFNHQEYITTVTGSGAQLSFLTQNSGTYSDLLAEIKAKQDELANMKPWQKASESGRELQGEIDALIAKLGDLGVAMKVDALKTAIEANGDVTEKEYGMMLDYMVKAGVITEQTAKTMMEDWRELNNFQQSLRWDAEGNIIMIADDAYKTIEELKRQLKSIERTIGITVNVSQMGQLPRGITSHTEALGGAVYPGRQYLWQEPGRDGELLIPEKYGRVMNQVEVAQALREAFTPSKETPRASQEPVTNNYYYSLTMPTTSNPADVRTAFELMEAWN